MPRKPTKTKAAPSTPAKPNRRGVKGEPIRDRNGNVVGGKKGRSGRKAGHIGALKNGTGHKPKRRLTVGELPATMVSVKREGCKYRRDLEAEVLLVKGDINLVDAHLIDTASAATIQAGICRWLLRHKLDTMNTNDIRGCTADIVKSKERRDKAVQQLHLDAKPEAPWVLDAPVVGETDAE